MQSIAVGNHYLYYTGNMIFNTGYTVERFRATGRVMSDPFNFARFNPNNVSSIFFFSIFISQSFKQQNNFVWQVAPSLQPSKNVYLTEDDDQKTSTEIPDDKIFSTLPTITGFSFTVKRWGEMHIRFFFTNENVFFFV